MATLNDAIAYNNPTIQKLEIKASNKFPGHIEIKAAAVKSDMKCTLMKGCKCKACSMSAGGPGSGRHGGGNSLAQKPGKPVNEKSHTGLIDLGYKHAGNYKDKTSKVSVYQSKDGSHEIHVRPTGNTRMFKQR